MPIELSSPLSGASKNFVFAFNSCSRPDSEYSHLPRTKRDHDENIGSGSFFNPKCRRRRRQTDYPGTNTSNQGADPVNICLWISFVGRQERAAVWWNWRFLRWVLSDFGPWPNHIDSESSSQWAATHLLTIIAWCTIESGEKRNLLTAHEHGNRAPNKASATFIFRNHKTSRANFFLLN